MAWLGGGDPSFLNIYRVITGAPNKPEELKLESWKAHSYLAHCIREGEKRWGDNGNDDFNMCVNFWTGEWPNTSDRQRAVGYSICTNTLDKLLSGPLVKLLCGTTTVSPANITDDGSVVVVDAPTVRWGAAGQFIGVVLKLLTQQHVLRRDPSIEHRPVVIWQDEAQLFCLPDKDYEVQSVARAARLISVILTQSLPGLHAALGGGQRAEKQAASWLGNHSTKILCANSCVHTNRYCSELCGSDWVDIIGGGMSGGQPDYDPMDDLYGRGIKGGPTLNWHPQYKPDLPPEEWTRLTKGGRGIVEAIAFQNGRIFENGKVWQRVYFKQG